MKKDLPLVSVVMPNYNTPEPFLRAAIESVLGQTYTNIELIIVDDASTGNNVDIIQSYHDKRIVLVQNESNQHIAYSINRGFDLAKGQYIARMDSDDICLPKRIEKQVRFLQRRADIDVSCTQIEIFGDRKGVFATNIRDSEAMRIATFFNCPIANPSVMFRASFIHENALRFKTDLAYRSAEDYEFWSRCVSIGNIYEYPQALLKYRTHNKQVSFSASKMQIESANHVRKNMLFALGIVPDTHEMDIHYKFCTEEASGEISLKEIEDWAFKLLKSNKQYDVYHSKMFEQLVLEHFFLIAIKSLIKKQVTLQQVMKSRFTFKILSPLYYPKYLKRYLFSKRLNQSP